MDYVVLGEIVVKIGSYICMYEDLLKFTMGICSKSPAVIFATGNL
ncbi:MAG: hypothetical protein ABFC34_01290 [Methanobacterium sp.]